MLDTNTKEETKRFISVKEMKEKYPNGDFKVVGEYIKNKEIDNSEGYEVKLLRGYTKRVRNNGFYKRSFYKVGAYQATETSDEYVAVLKRDYKIAFITLALALLMIIGGYLLWNMNKGPDIDPSIKDYVSDLKRPDNLDETKILVPGLTKLVMGANTDVLSGTTLFNPDDNPCYFQFTIVESNGDVLYESKLVPPGKGVSDAKLNRVVKKGTYKVSIKIKTYDLNNYEAEFNGAEIDSELVALE